MPKISRSESAIYIDGDAIRQVNKELYDLYYRIGDWKTRTKILQQGGDILVEEARRLAPVGKRRKRDHSIERYFPPKKLKEDVKYTYDTPKINKKRKAGQGYGRVSGKYGLTSLANSIVDIADAKKRMRTYKVVVGPLYTRRKAVVNPTPGKANGWYSHMVYGSARAFFQRVTGRALQNKQQRIYQTIQQEVEFRTRQVTTKNQFVK